MHFVGVYIYNVSGQLGMVQSKRKNIIKGGCDWFRLRPYEYLRIVLENKNLCGYFYYYYNTSDDRSGGSTWV